MIVAGHVSTPGIDLISHGFLSEDIEEEGAGFLFGGEVRSRWGV
jgi:hypothetical protein